MLSLVGYGEGMSRLMNGNWKGLADQEELAEAAGVGTSTVQLLERGEPRSQMPRTMPKIARVLGWAPEHARQIVEGKDVDPFADGGPLARVPLTQEQKDVFREWVLRNPAITGAAQR